MGWMYMAERIDDSYLWMNVNLRLDFLRKP